MTYLMTRILHRGRRILWCATEPIRAGREGVRLGPDNFCYVEQSDWQVVVDAGVGKVPTFAPWIKQKTNAFVVLCDPTPRHLPKLRAWVAAEDRAELIEAAVANDDGRIAFFESSVEESGSVDDTHINRGAPGRVVGVDGISLGSLLNRASRHGAVALVKLDLEGAEFEIFREARYVTDIIESVPQWFIEFHLTPRTKHSLSDMSRIRKLFRLRRFREFSRNGVDYLFWRT